jgi:hypothetical protein
VCASHSVDAKLDWRNESNLTVSAVGYQALIYSDDSVAVAMRCLARRISAKLVPRLGFPQP